MREGGAASDTSLPTSDLTAAPDAPRAAALLSERGRKGVAFSLVLLAIAHVVLPKLAIDAIFLGLLAFASLVLLFDIESVEWLGVKAKRRALKKQVETVEAVDVTTVAADPPPPRINAQAHHAQPTVIHRRPMDLMPPVERVERLLWAAEQIRIELIILAGNSGQLPGKKGFAEYRATELASLLGGKGIVPVGLVGPIHTIISQRNAAAQPSPLDRGVLEPASQLALSILVKLREIPRSWSRVLNSEVELFLDRSLSAAHPASPGVTIVQLNSQGRHTSKSVLPSLPGLTNGRFVTWEWDMGMVYDQEAWYEDPETGKPALAFSSAATFAGREYPDQWGIEYRIGGPMEV